MNIRRLKNIFVAVGPYLFFALIVFLLFCPSLFLPPNKLLSNGDLQLYDYYTISFLRQSLARGEFPWWNPHTFSGTPFIANPYMNLLYLPKWLLVVLPLNTGFSWYMAIHVWLAMAGMYWFLQRYVRSIPAMVGALAFGLSGRVIGQVYPGYIDVIAATAWMPITTGVFLAAMEKPRPWRIAFAGVICAIQFVSGYQTISLFTLQIIGVFTLIFALVKKSWLPILLFVFITCIGAGLASVQLIPIQEFIVRTVRSDAKNADWFYYGSLPPREVLQLLFPFISGDVSLYYKYIGYWERALYIGIVPFLLSLFGVVIWSVSVIKKQTAKLLKTRDHWLIPASCIITILAIWISFGNTISANLQGVLIAYLPWYRYIRVPTKHLTIAAFGLSILAGFGLQGIQQLHKRWARILGVIAIIATTVDLLMYAHHFIVIVESPDTRQDPALIRTISGTSYPSDRYIYQISGLQTLNILDANAPLAYGSFSANGYDVTDLHSYYSFINATNHAENTFTGQQIFVNPTSQAVNYLNIRYLLYQILLVPPPGLENYPVERLDYIRYYVLYRNPNVLPRFFIVPDVAAARTPDDAYNLIATDKVNLSRTVVLTGQKDLPAATCKTPLYKAATITSYKTNSISLHVNAPCSGWLVSSEVMFPGWQAFIDGHKTALYEGNLAFRTIFVPAGYHTVIYTFYPSIYLLGAAVSIITLSLLIFWVTVSSKTKLINLHHLPRPDKYLEGS